MSYTKNPANPSELKIIEENHYYPFGLKHENYNSEEFLFDKKDSNLQLRAPVVKEVLPYQYKFVGQERQDELGINWDSFRHRNYDYAIGRFMGIDPVSEDYMSISTYQFAHNNPVWKIELEGLEGITSNNTGDIINDEPSAVDKGLIWVTDFLFSGAETTFGNPTLSTVAPRESIINQLDDAVGEIDRTIESGKNFLKDPGGTAKAVLEGIGQTFSDLTSGDASKMGSASVTAIPLLFSIVNPIPGDEIVAAERVVCSGLKNAGRSGKQARLRELANDPKVSKADKGWIKNEMRHVKNGNRKSIRNPGNSRNSKARGKELAHPRGKRAKDGHSYKDAKLQDADLHKLEHKHGGY